MQNVSETGQTVDYACNNCERNITVKILPDKDGMRAVEKLNQIKSIFVKEGVDVDKEVTPDFRGRITVVAAIFTRHVHILKVCYLKKIFPRG